MEKQAKDPRNVFVVHGRNLKLRDSMFEFLKALDLHPLDWSELISSTGKTAPYIGEILDKAFSQAQAVVVLLTPDDEGRLRDQFIKNDDPPYEKETTPQPRMNVVFEAGIAMGRDEKRVIIVEIGNIRPFSDIGGRYAIRMDNTIDKRSMLAKRLSDANCKTDMYNDKWTKVGNFELGEHSTKEDATLNEPLEENYETIENHFFQIRKRGKYSDNAHIPRSTKSYLIRALTAYCKYMNMNPDAIIRDAKKELSAGRGVDKHNKHLDKFYMGCPQNSTPWNFFNYIRAFYKHNGINITTIRPPRKEMRKNNIRSIKTNEIRKICMVAPIFHSSWMLVNSYLGIGVGKITKLKVSDFCTEKWDENRDIYPVNISKAVSGTFDYTTFIGKDSKEFLARFLRSKKFKQEDNLWNCPHATLNDGFKRHAYNAKVIDAPKGFILSGAPRGLFDLTPSSFRYRLISILEDYHVPSNWIGLLTGTKRRNPGSRPTTEQLQEVFQKAFPKLCVFPKMPPTLPDY